MKLPLASVVFAAALALVAAADVLPSTVRFSNGDHLSGTMESLTTERLVWKSPLLEKPTPFFLKSVLDLTLAAGQPEIPARHEASLTLTNGDLIRGQLASVTDDTVELDTWFAGRVKFKRLVVADIRIAERPDVIYRGPAGLDGWKQSADKPAWIYRNSGLHSVAAGSIARNMELPDECSIAFDAAWRGSFGLDLALFSDDLASDRPATGYLMSFRQRFVSLRSCKTQRQLGNPVNAASLQENEKARIELRVSLKSGKVCLLVDGHLLEVWTDPDVARDGVGRGIHFITTLNSSPLQISRIEVSAWDGEVDQLPERPVAGGFRQFGLQENQDEPEPAPEQKPATGRMELRNGDNLAGEVVAISDGMITVKTPFRDVKLPIESLRSLALKPAALERCKRENGDVRGWFPDGSSLVFRLDGVGEGTLTGYSQNFGTAAFTLAAFSRIEFNIYDPDSEDIRTANGW